MFKNIALASSLAIAAALAGCGGGGDSAGVDSVRSVTVDGRSYTYRLHVPAHADAAPAPLVISLHGGGSNALLHDTLTQLPAKADAAGFVLLTANGYTDNDGTLYGWNAGACCDPATADNIDHVAIIRAMLDDAASSVAIDPRRVFATGYSNGGMMAYRLACQMSDRIAAIALAAGEMMDKDLSLGLERTVFTCDPPRAVPILHMHGLADTCALFEGGVGTGAQPRPPRSAVPDNIAFWREHNQCSATPTTDYQQGGVTCQTYSGCSADAAVRLCTIENGGHIWPGAAAYGLEDSCGGTQTANLDANDELWAFFQQHPMPVP